jgi:hypothetical protein
MINTSDELKKKNEKTSKFRRKTENRSDVFEGK